MQRTAAMEFPVYKSGFKDVVRHCFQSRWTSITPNERPSFHPVKVTLLFAATPESWLSSFARKRKKRSHNAQSEEARGRFAEIKMYTGCPASKRMFESSNRRPIPGRFPLACARPEIKREAELN